MSAHIMILRKCSLLAVLSMMLLSQPAWGARHETVAIGLDVGSGATYGNSLSMQWRWFEHSALNFGLGYNSSGAKIGVGHNFIFNVVSNIGITLGNALVYSAGTDGEVDIDADFTPEGSAKEQEITAVKNYELSPAMLFGFSVGAFWDYFKFLRLNTQICYNFPFWGNEVTLGRRITYNEDVEISNEEQFNEEFDREAEKTVKAGGLGFSVGAAILF